MAGRNDSGTNIPWTAISVAIAIVLATFTVVTHMDSIDERDEVRSTQMSGRLKVIEGFLREKYPEFSNFARKESAVRLAKGIEPLITVPIGAQKSAGTLGQYNPQTHSIAFQNATDQTENFQLPSDVEIWFYIPNLRRVRRLSGANASSVLAAAIRNGGAAVIVYNTSDRAIKGIYLSPSPADESSSQVVGE
jgi:hypothetical protein